MLCECGTGAIIHASELYGDVRILSCGQKCPYNANTYHGDARRSGRTPEYKAWVDIINRCTNPSATFFEYYGGRGINICEEWRHSYPAFFAYVGRKPTPRHSIDRWPDNNGNYEPGNVRWATRTQQARNKRTTCFLTANGVTRPIAEWAELNHIDVRSIRTRIYQLGWDVGLAVTRPTRHIKARNKTREDIRQWQKTQKQ